MNAYPDVLVVDEVLAVGDQSFQQKCMERIAELRASGTSLLVASHSTELIELVCGEAIHLQDGAVVRQGPAAEVCQAYREAAAAPKPAKGAEPPPG